MIPWIWDLFLCVSLHQFNGDPFHQSFSMATHFMKRIELQSGSPTSIMGVSMFSFTQFFFKKYKLIFWLLLQMLDKIVNIAQLEALDHVYKEDLKRIEVQDRVGQKNVKLIMSEVGGQLRNQGLSWLEEVESVREQFRTLADDIKKEV